MLDGDEYLFDDFCCLCFWESTTKFIKQTKEVTSHAQLGHKIEVIIVHVNLFKLYNIRMIYAQ